jgi:hypothetical protein
MIVTVVETREFQVQAKSIMSDQERILLIDYIARNPYAGVGLGGGVRKFRFARTGAGKSSGFRVVYFYNQDDDTPIFLITAFAKNEKANLSSSELETIRGFGQSISKAYRSFR